MTIGSRRARAAWYSTTPPGEELVGGWPLLAVGVFALNNLVLKRAFANVLTGKLSDLTCCFFLPLFVSATLGYLGVRAHASRRVMAGAVVTAVVFGLVKTWGAASALLDEAVALLASPFGFTTPNRVDPTDLVALPVVVLAVLYARRRFPPPHEGGVA